MLRFLVFNQESRSASFITSGVLFLVFLVTAVLSLQTPTHESLVPYAPFLMFALQVGLPVLVLPFLRWRFTNGYNTIIFVFIVLASLLLFCLASSFWSDFPKLVLQRSIIIFVPVILIGLLVWADSRPLVTFIMISRGLVTFSCCISAIGIFLFFFGSKGLVEGTPVQSISLGPITLSQNLSGTPPLLRISSLMGNPNALAMWLLLSVPLTLYLIHIRRIGHIVGIVLVVLQLFALALTYSRAGIGASLVALGAYYYWSARRSVERINRVVLGLVVATLVLMSSILLLGLEQFQSQRFSITLNGRDSVWGLLTDAFIQNLFFGVGFGVSYEAILMPHNVKIASHNAHLQTLVEIGVFGSFLVLILWLVPLRVCLGKLRSLPNKDDRLSLVVGASLLEALFVHQFFEGSLLRYGFHTLYWSYLLFVVVHPGMKGRSSGSDSCGLFNLCKSAIGSAGKLPQSSGSRCTGSIHGGAVTACFEDLKVAETSCHGT